MTEQKKTLVDRLRAFVGPNNSPLFNKFSPLFNKFKYLVGLNEEYIDKYTNKYINKLAETKNIPVDSIDYLSLSTEQKIAKLQTDIDDVKEQMNNLEDKIDFIIRIIQPNTMR
ncbi:hypothetical protein [Aerosakkonema funiforme]|uniref:hypothetical protein n=1 Tax=Aerosakkonema funiforme TaxID=1246630 RepID=UPI0035B7CFC6